MKFLKAAPSFEMLLSWETGQNRGNFNRYTKRPLQDSAIIFSTPGKGESAFHCANHRVSCKCQQPPGWKIHRFFRWKMPFAVFRSGSGVSDKNKESPTSGLQSVQSVFLGVSEPMSSESVLQWGSTGAKRNCLRSFPMTTSFQESSI